MFDHITEIMLRSYFIAENTVGKFCADKEALFFTYAHIFLLKEEEASRLFALAGKEEVRAIRSEGDFHRCLRMRRFLDEDRPSTELEDLIDIKGTAYTIALGYHLLEESGEIRSSACETVVRAAENGLVLGLTTLGILQMEGFVFEKDRESGMKNLRCAADWDSEEGLFAALYYGLPTRESLLERLREELIRVGHGEEFGKVTEAYGDTMSEGKGEFRLLEKAFRQGVIKRETYNKSYARLVYSGLLSAREKESLVLTPNKDLFAEACTLPLKLGEAQAVFHAEALEGVRPGHPEQAEQLICGLGNADLRTVDAYRPLCFVSDSAYLLNYYAGLVARSFEAPHVERIEVGDLIDYDFEPTKNHIFVRSCDEDAFNIYLLFFRGEIADRAFDLVKYFLRTEKRRKFRLNHPGVALDLSAVLPVCFCDRENAHRLKEWCDLIRIPDLTAGEKVDFTERCVREKGKIYGIGKLTMQEGLAGKLSAYGIDEIDMSIDTAVRMHRMRDLELTEAMVLPYLRSASKKNTIGFGGNIHDD